MVAVVAVVVVVVMVVRQRSRKRVVASKHGPAMRIHDRKTNRGRMRRKPTRKSSAKSRPTSTRQLRTDIDSDSDDNDNGDYDDVDVDGDGDESLESGSQIVPVRPGRLHQTTDPVVPLGQVDVVRPLDQATKLGKQSADTTMSVSLSSKSSTDSTGSNSACPGGQRQQEPQERRRVAVEVAAWKRQRKVERVELSTLKTRRDRLARIRRMSKKGTEINLDDVAEFNDDFEEGFGRKNDHDGGGDDDHDNDHDEAKQTAPGGRAVGGVTVETEHSI